MSTTIAVDLAKLVFQVAVSERAGRIREQLRLTRGQFERFVATLPAATIVMEACGTAAIWGRHAQAHGHRPILLPPHAVRPYVPGNKTDRIDTKGLLEALRNEAIHPVPLKVATLRRSTQERAALGKAGCGAVRFSAMLYGPVLHSGSASRVTGRWPH